MATEFPPTNLRVRIVGKKAQKAVYTTKDNPGSLSYINPSTPYDDQYWYIIPNHQQNRIGTFQIQNAITHQNVFMRASWSGDEGEIGTDGPDISKDDQAIRLVLGTGDKVGLYRFERQLGEKTFRLYCRETWQPPTLGCVNLTKEYDDQWFSFDFEPLDFVKIDYHLEQAVVQDHGTPEIFNEKQVNHTDIQQEQTFKISKTTHRESRWEFAMGYETSAKEGIQVGVPDMANASVEVSETLKADFTTAGAVITDESWEATVTLKCDGKKTTRCTASVSKSTIEVPCTTTYKSKKTGELIELKGTYKGTGNSDFSTAFNYV